MSNLVDIPAPQRLYYDQLFKVADVDGDGVIGLSDSAFFKKSGLPNSVLGEVWQLSDYRKVGNLDKEGFFVALSLISLAQQGKRLGLDAVRDKVPPPKLMDVPPMKQDAPPMPTKQDPGDWVVSPQERKLYLDIFRQNDDDGDGFITGAQARNLFSSSGLPLQLLGQIWLMADLNKDQRLDPHEFIIAMFLIANRKRGFELPPVVPESLISSAWPEPSSPTITPLPLQNPALSTPVGTEWIIPPAEKVKYDDLFKKTDSDLDGFVSGDQARNLFLRSGVPMADLSRIWLLSDITQDQRLDKQEFAIAMFLIYCRIRGRELPTPLPDILIASARDDFVPPRSTGTSITKGDKSRYENFSIDDVGGGPAPSVPPLPTSGSNSSIPTSAMSLPSESHHSQVPSLESTRRHNSAQNLLLTGQPTLTGPFLGSGQNQPVAHSPAVGLNPAVNSAPAVLQPGGAPFSSLNPPFAGVPLVPNAALEVERTRQTIAHHEKTKTDMTEQLKEVSNIATESARMLEEERARSDVLVAEISDLEAQIGDQRARGNMYKDNITNIRLQVKNMTTQKEQLEELLKEKRLQCEDQEQILTDLRIELGEKTNEVEKCKSEIEQLKARLEHMRTATTEVKAQLAGSKKNLNDSKSEINRLNEEAKSIRTSSSPPPTARASSPMNSHPGTPTLPSLHPPVQRTASMNAAFHQDSNPTSAVSSPAFPHSATASLTSSPATTPFHFPPPANDTFSFDNGREDPFAFPSKDGFGLANVTNDSFGPSSLSLQNTPSPPHPAQDTPVFSENSFFGTSDAFGDSKDPFAKKGSAEVSADPFAASYSFGGAVSGKDAFEAFGASSLTQESFGSGPSSVVVPPTPHNTVIGERKGGLSGADIASAFSAAAFGGSSGSETTNSFFGTEDSFGAFSNTNDSFGSATNDSFLSSHDAFSSGGRSDSLRDSGGFSRGSGAFPAVEADSFGKQRGSGAFPSVDSDKQRGSGAFPVIDTDKYRGSGAFPPMDGERQRGSGAFPVIDTDKHRGSGAFHAVTEADAFGKRDSGAHKAMVPDDTSSHPFGSDAFSTTDAFGTANAFGSSSSNAFGSPDAFSTNDAFGTGGDAFSSTDAFGKSDVFGKSDAFGKSDVFGGSGDAFGSDVFGKSDAFGNTQNNAFENGGGANGAKEEKFGDGVFGKQPDSFGTFDFATEKKDGFDF